MRKVPNIPVPHTHTYRVNMNVYVYTYIERKRKRERERDLLYKLAYMITDVEKSHDLLSTS